MGWTKIKTLTFSLLMTLGGLTACNRVGDQYCDVGSNPDDPSDQCPYGIANKVNVDLEPCPPIPPRQDSCDPMVSWTSTIWPLLTASPTAKEGEIAGGGCAQGGNCHDQGQSRGVLLTKFDPKDPFPAADAAWNVLTSYRGGQASTYLGTRDSWILCNLQGRAQPGGVGVTMPPTKEGLNPAALDKVRKWAECDQRQYTEMEKMMMGGGT